jgi:hypothetical protein
VISFINILLANSKLKQAKLYNAAKKAFETPSIGITINNPAAAHVIKDCAEITLKYLPLYVLAGYENLFQQLQQKFTKQDINEFVTLAKQDPHLNQLLLLILDKAKKQFPAAFESKLITESTQDSSLSDDPYSDYYSERVAETKPKSIEEVLHDVFKCVA